MSHLVWILTFTFIEGTSDVTLILLEMRYSTSTTSRSTSTCIWQQNSRIVGAGMPPPLLKTFVKAVKWFCHINMSARDPISSPPSTRWQNSTSSLKSSPSRHSVTLHKQTNRDKRQPGSCMSKCNSLKAKKRRKHPAPASHLTTHSFWITLEYMRTPRQWGALPWFLMYDYFIWTGEGGEGELSVGVIDTSPH